MWPGLDDGLVWIGVLETCDLCCDEFTMSWIEFDGKQFLCLACRSESKCNTPIEEHEKK